MQTHPPSVIALFAAALLFVMACPAAAQKPLPGEAVMADVSRERDDTITQFNEFGSYGSFYNGIRAWLPTRTFDIGTEYSYRNVDGYREHSNLYAHNFSLDLSTAPSSNTGLRITGRYHSGRYLMPGSLTWSEFEADPWKADPRVVARNEYRETNRGSVVIQYSADFGRERNHRVEVEGTGQIEYFTRTTREFKITTRYILGLSARYSYTTRFWDRRSEFTAGADIFDQPERKEEYENWGGVRSDFLEQIEVEQTITSACWFREDFEILPEKLLLKLSGRYNHVIYNVAEATLPARSDRRIYDGFIPGVTLEYNPVGAVTLFATASMAFRNPTDRELESPDPSYLYNKNLQAQTTTTLKAGVKTTLSRDRSAVFFRKFKAEAAVFRAGIRDEIIQYEVYGDLYYRNASKTDRYGAYLKGKLEIIRDLELTFGYTWSHYIYKSYLTNSIETDSTGNILSVERDFSGKAEPNIPKNRFDLALAYKLRITGWMKASAKVAWQASSRLWVDDLNSRQTDAFRLLGAEIGADFRFGRFTCSVKGGVNNIFNRVYVGSANINSADYRFYDAGSPRDIFGAVNFAFVF